MNLKEAMEDGRPFRRPCWSFIASYVWVNEKVYATKNSDCPPEDRRLVFNGPGVKNLMASFMYADIVATDYEFDVANRKFMLPTYSDPVAEFDFKGNLVWNKAYTVLGRRDMDALVKWIHEYRVATGKEPRLDSIGLSLVDDVVDDAGDPKPWCALFTESRLNLPAGQITLAGAQILAKWINDYLERADKPPT